MTVRSFSRAILLVLGATALSLVLSSAAAAKERRYIVGFHNDPGADTKGFIERHRGKFRRKFRRFRAADVELSEDAVTELQNDPNVAYVEADALVSLVAPIYDGIEYQNSWGVTHIGSPETHSRGVLGDHVKVAILDTGLDYTHPELAAQYAGGARFVLGDHSSMDPMDDNGHGTHVAGIIAAAANGEGVIGVAPNVSIYAVKVLHASTFGLVSDVIAGIEWALDQGVDVINLSIGDPNYSQALAEACAQAEAAGVLIVASAGNSVGGAVMYPAAYPSVVAVGATLQDDTVFYGSAIGPEIELAAPGGHVFSTDIFNLGAYSEKSGTSQAAPHVTGVAALILSAGLMDLNGDGKTDNYDLRMQLQAGATDLGMPGRDSVFGYGLVNAKTALLALNERKNKGKKRRRCNGWGNGHGQDKCEGWEHSAIRAKEWHLADKRKHERDD